MDLPMPPAVPYRCRRLICLMVAVATLHATSCGAIIHPERVGQPRHGRLDPGVILLDGLGLLLFFIPGVIAFIVDFSTGAIYLPPGYSSTDAPGEWTVVRVPKDELTRVGIQQAVAKQTGKPLDLQDEQVRVETLRTIDELPTGARARFVAPAGE